MNEISRDKGIVRTGFVGIIANLLLSGAKALVGLIAGSISVILDAINNLSDAVSSLLTVIGTKLAGKAPDKKHPLGHGRIEYLTSLIIGAIIISVAVSSGIESFKKIINATEPDYSIVSIIVISIAIVGKLLLALYTLRKGKQYHSETLKGSGKDALFDVLLSVSTLIGVVFFMTLGVNIDGYLGVVIAVFILKTGIEIIADSISELLGKRADPELTKGIRETVLEFEEVMGVYDLYLENYGPDKIIGSLHVEIADTMTCKEIDDLSRKISGTVYMKYHIALTIGIYAIDVTNQELVTLRKKITSLVLNHEGVLQVHGFKYVPERNMIMMDVVKDFSYQDSEKFKNSIIKELSMVYPQYEYYLVIDIDYSD